MIEQQLQAGQLLSCSFRWLEEQRVSQFRQKLARRRKGQDSEGEEWHSYLKRPVPATDLSIRSIREAQNSMET